MLKSTWERGHPSPRGLYEDCSLIESMGREEGGIPEWSSKSAARFHIDEKAIPDSLVPLLLAPKNSFSRVMGIHARV